MNYSTRGCARRNLQCKICQINFSTEADFALHEFSKRHCHNLLNISKNKPIFPKKKPVQSIDIKPIVKETPKSQIVAQRGSIAKYGYFVPGELYVSNFQSTFDIQHDPYAERCNVDSCRGEGSLIVNYQATDCHPYKPENAQASCSKRKKKKKSKFCQICQLTFTRTVDYNAHLKSPQHMWMLKISGKGVSAHFVKSGRDLHTTEVNERAKSESKEALPSQLPSVTRQQEVQSECEKSSPQQILSCHTSKILFNNPNELSEHTGDKCHLINLNQVPRSKVKKEKEKLPLPSHLYCYSCKISLNNMSQYNDHKNGKKHKIKCKQLMREGITIPLQETLPDWPLPTVHPKKTVIFPDFYENFLERKKASDLSQEEENTSNLERDQLIHQFLPTSPCSKYAGMNEVDASSVDSILTRKCKGRGQDTEHLCAINSDSCRTSNDDEHLKEGEFPDRMGNVVVLTDEETLTCQICDENFIFQSLFDSHLASENHLLKVWKKKKSGVSDWQILSMILTDRNKIKPDEQGRWNCFVCDIISNTIEEFMQHINTFAHRNTENEYIQKKTVEVTCIRTSDEQGSYSCELCREGFKSLVDFCRHLPTDHHLSKAKSSQIWGNRKSDFLTDINSTQFQINNSN